MLLLLSWKLLDEPYRLFYASEKSEVIIEMRFSIDFYLITFMISRNRDYHNSRQDLCSNKLLFQYFNLYCLLGVLNFRHIDCI